ncbi:tyrosine-protein kinase family protein [Gymnodinialimonas ulvae]|uniref:tyrosine-protein kinase family protein n=1 Tax=Gymnodinialimonas ulvae TaxID=3126504 RepID=UPI00309F69E5
MEKLRLALQKARAQRGEAAPVLDTRRRVPAPAAIAVTQLWEELPGFEPNPKALAKSRIVTQKANPAAIPFDRMANKTLMHMRKNDWRRLAITSATPNCGKTQVAANLAFSLARQPDLRVMLIELDMRRPSLAALIGATPVHDIADVLAGDVPFEEQTLRIGSNLTVSLATQSYADPGQLLLNTFTQDVLRDIETRYRPDLVIFDMPPLLAGAYAMAFLSNVDCALTVARAGKSTVSQIDQCERETAEQTNVLGIILNQCNFSDDAASGTYDYGY